MNKVRVLINGFGRIGRTIARINAEKDLFDLVAINDIDPYADNMAYLFKYDTTYGRFEGDVDVKENNIVIGGKPINYFGEADLKNVPLQDLGIDCVIDASGVYNCVETLKELCGTLPNLTAVVTHSSKIVDKEIIMGVNDDIITPEDKLFSNSICDANAIAHPLKWLNDEFGIKNGSVTTVHPWLSYQNLVDGPSKSQRSPGLVWTDYSLGRNSINNLIPKNTTAVSATEKVITEIAGLLASFSYRVPTDIVSSSDITLGLNQDIDLDTLSSFLESKAATSKYIGVNKDSRVSTDYKKESHSGIIDMQWLKSHNGLVKIIVWYDNEWGYGSRAIDLALKVSQR